ncbi:hypothetical protein NAPIS_ORF02596 [Vairimorpha apis BRL 01]|uniref:Uncharacterized protein n=1 Tax=Vairimorpha apis BRL 01 TaxID=1037528 RepID=T0MFH1_9MICR|nr:hypothetical protein NAPIS_ORF02596 [Vairimorpha apis BRL 01]
MNIYFFICFCIFSKATNFNDNKNVNIAQKHENDKLDVQNTKISSKSQSNSNTNGFFSFNSKCKQNNPIRERVCYILKPEDNLNDLKSSIIDKESQPIKNQNNSSSKSQNIVISCDYSSTENKNFNKGKKVFQHHNEPLCKKKDENNMICGIHCLCHTKKIKNDN